LPFDLKKGLLRADTKKVFAKNLPVVAERDSFFGRRTKEDRRQKFRRFAKTEALHD